MKTSRARLARARERLFTQLCEMLPFCRGTLSQTYLTCGKPGCACARDAAHRHGPYYQWTVMEKGKIIHRTLRPAVAEVVGLGIARRAVFEEWCRTFAGHMEEQALAGVSAGEKGGAGHQTPSPLAAVTKRSGSRRAAAR
jgi:hypothetical protein